MGYFNDQEGIMRRYIREADQWKLHLENTQKAILKAIANKGRKKIAILGSGWLLDVPILELTGKFEEVWLFDIKHPAQIKRKVEKLKNIKLVETDISGFALTIYTMVREFKKSPLNFSIEDIKPNFDFELNDFDMVVSCNILNQLDIILIDYLKSTMKISPNMELQLRNLIQETHIERLPKSKSFIISDVEEMSLDKENKIINRRSLIHMDRLPKIFKKEWIWHFDNHCMYKPNCNTWFKVIALDF